MCSHSSRTVPSPRGSAFRCDAQFSSCYISNLSQLRVQRNSHATSSTHRCPGRSWAHPPPLRLYAWFHRGSKGPADMRGFPASSRWDGADPPGLVPAAQPHSASHALRRGCTQQCTHAGPNLQPDGSPPAPACPAHRLQNHWDHPEYHSWRNDTPRLRPLSPTLLSSAAVPSTLTHLPEHPIPEHAISE